MVVLYLLGLLDDVSRLLLVVNGRSSEILNGRQLDLLKVCLVLAAESFIRNFIPSLHDIICFGIVKI